MQSSTLALMIAHGEIPMVDHAIFADTGAEPASVMRWLDWLEEKLPFPVHRVMHKEGIDVNIRAAAAGGRFVSAPFFTESDRAGGGTLRRQCTREYKIDPITKKLRELVGLVPRQRAPREPVVTQLIGISWDEVQRMKPNREPWITNEWPLIDRQYTRGHCLDWMTAHKYPMPPRSACYFCPYKSNHEWKRLRDDEPQEWDKAVALDQMIRQGLGKTDEKIYLHRDLKPLAEVDLRTAEDFGQVDAFGNECEGMCGV